jgi:two-component system, response regulator, stage 0 sporulation protein A
MNRQAEITCVLRAMGAPAKLLGYHMAKDAVEMILDDKSLRTQLTDSLYPLVAKRHNTEASRVERNIRHLADYTWKNGDQAELRRLFGRPKKRPSAGQFLAVIAEEISVFRMPELGGVINDPTG